jgi:hypothetical protein
MRMPRFRFTVRGMMVVVAVACLALGLEQMRKRRSLYLATAGAWSETEADYLGEAGHNEDYATRMEEIVVRYRRALVEIGPLSGEAEERIQAGGKEASEYRVEAEQYRARSAWAAELRRKYVRAARYPWLPVPPDPPPPN